MDALKYMLLDVVTELRDQCVALRRKGARLDDYERGRRFGLFEAMALIDRQAKSFGIDRSEIGLTFDVETVIFDQGGTPPEAQIHPPPSSPYPPPMTCADVADFRRLARKRLPRFLFDYVDGGSWNEETLRRNVDDFARLALRQRVMRDAVPAGFPDGERALDVRGALRAAARQAGGVGA